MKEKLMRNKNRVSMIVLAVFLGISIVPTLGWAGTGTPTDAMKQTSNAIIRILEDPAWKKPEKKQERRKLLEDVIGQRFNYVEMARRTLGAEWAKHSPVEQEEFAADFQTLLTNTYLDGLEQYSGEKVQYLKELNDGEYAVVFTKIDKGWIDLDLTYKVVSGAGEWRVYDVEVDGVSLLQNYREQFLRVIRKYSFAELSKQLRTKADRIKAAAYRVSDTPRSN
jgi:phospholipid transport system substrate-binding protein